MLRFGSRPTVPVPRLVFGLTAAPPVVLVAASQTGDAQSVAKLAGLKVGLSAPGAPEHTWLLGLLAIAARERRAGADREPRRARGVEAAGAADVHAGMVADPAATRLLDERPGRPCSPTSARRQSVRGARGTDGQRRRVRPQRAAGQRRGSRRLRPGPAGRARAHPEHARHRAGRRLPAAVVGLPDEFETRLAATREIYLPDGRVTPEQLRHTIELIRAHQPLPASLKLPPPEDILYLEPLRRARSPDHAEGALATGTPEGGEKRSRLGSGRPTTFV